MGPQRGVKFRGGAPPLPPIWSYSSNDIRAFEKFEKKVKVWELQVRHYVTEAEAGLALYTSLKGEAEQELEFIDINSVYKKGGVDTILNYLRAAFQQKNVYVKRQYLHYYETVGRWPGESTRSFVNRYRRIEASLKAIGVDVSLTYDDESRDSRLLDRARLSIEQQCLVLVGTNQTLQFDAIRSSLLLQYPEHKPAPPVAGRDATTAPFQPKGGSKGYNNNTNASSSSSASSSSVQKGKGNVKGNRRVFQAETIPEETAAEEADEQAQDDADEPQDDYDAHEQDENDDAPEQGEPDENDNMQELAQVLTITARKLASMTQGRKFSGQPKKSIQEKKKTSICAACGQKGHWAGDPECEVAATADPRTPSTSSATPSQKGKGKGTKGRDDRDGGNSKR